MFFKYAVFATSILGAMYVMWGVLNLTFFGIRPRIANVLVATVFFIVPFLLLSYSIWDRDSVIIAILLFSFVEFPAWIVFNLWKGSFSPEKKKKREERKKKKNNE